MYYKVPITFLTIRKWQNYLPKTSEMAQTPLPIRFESHLLSLGHRIDLSLQLRAKLLNHILLFPITDLKRHPISMNFTKSIAAIRSNRDQVSRNLAAPWFQMIYRLLRIL